jgi:hypothetical protein
MVFADEAAVVKPSDDAILDAIQAKIATDSAIPAGTH